MTTKEVQIEELEPKKDSSLLNIILIIISVIVVSLILLGFLIPNATWSLIICKTEMTGGGCDDIKKVITKLEDKEACEGEAKALKVKSFECGYDCKFNSLEMLVCKHF